jgi:ATP synthase F1 gamma subunit
MRQLQDIAREQHDMATISQLTAAFESLASMHLAQIKTQVLQAQAFFNELWQIYQQLRIDNLFRFGRAQEDRAITKELFLIITAEGGFSGDIDQRLVSSMLKEYDPSRNDIIVVGSHGVVLLSQLGVSHKKYFKLPNKDQNINVEPLIREVRQYKSAVAFYQTYVSLMVQDVKRIDIGKAVQAEGRHVVKSADVISEATYIFEPTAYDVVAHIERSMLQITMAQIIFDSKLAQYASRFRAMTSANERVSGTLGDLNLLYSRTRRETRDERLKEIMNGLNKVNTQ